jgi:SAM-dependent methyltransferase
VDPRDAAALIRGGVEAPGATWADLGAGTGTFTRALATLLGPGGTVYAVDRDRGALAALSRPSRVRPAVDATVVTIAADFTRPLSLPPLDGVVLANALHFVPAEEQAPVLGRVAALLRPGAALVLVEYDRRAASRWVPHPVSPTRFAALAPPAGLAPPTPLAERRSSFGGVIYSAVAYRRRE